MEDDDSQLGSPFRQSSLFSPIKMISLVPQILTSVARMFEPLVEQSNVQSRSAGSQVVGEASPSTQKNSCSVQLEDFDDEIMARKPRKDILKHTAKGNLNTRSTDRLGSEFRKCTRKVNIESSESDESPQNEEVVSSEVTDNGTEKETEEPLKEVMNKSLEKSLDKLEKKQTSDVIKSTKNEQREKRMPSTMEKPMKKTANETPNKKSEKSVEKVTEKVSETITLGVPVKKSSQISKI